MYSALLQSQTLRKNSRLSVSQMLPWFWLAVP